MRTDVTRRRLAIGAVISALGALAVASIASGQGTEDTDPPQTEITRGPGNGDTIADTTPTFEFSSNEAHSSFSCSPDGATFAACTSPHTTAPLAAGKHDFEVQATDSSGNTDKSPANRNFTVVLVVTTCGGQAATILGTDRGDELTGTPENDVIVALGGRDTIAATGGDDLVCAGEGDDTARGGGGGDLVRGQAGDDILSGRAGDDALIGAAGSDRCRGGPGADSARGCERRVGIP